MMMTMILVNVHDAKAKLSEYLEAAAKGERVVICKRNRPFAELRAIETTPAEPRPVGGAKGRLTVPDAFFDPLPDEVVGPFYGVPEGPSAAAPVAESSGKYRSVRGPRRKGRR